jgi:elongation factor G
VETPSTSSSPLAGIETISVNETSSGGEFVGVVDLVHMRAIVWPEAQNVSDVETCIPRITNLAVDDEDCPITSEAVAARRELLEAMAECDEQMEEYYLAEEVPGPAELRAALRRVTLSQRGIPVMASAALRGKGVEPVLDAIADLLPSPLDRRPPLLTCLENSSSSSSSRASNRDEEAENLISMGHPEHKSLLALAFKVVHMKGRGGSGDGRVVFARVYSGRLRDRDVVQVVSPPAPGEAPGKPRKERSEYKRL